MSKGQINDMYRQMEELFSKVEKLTNQIKKMRKLQIEMQQKFQKNK